MRHADCLRTSPQQACYGKQMLQAYDQLSLDCMLSKLLVCRLSAPHLTQQDRGMHSDQLHTNVLQKACFS